MTRLADRLVAALTLVGGLVLVSAAAATDASSQNAYKRSYSLEAAGMYEDAKKAMDTLPAKIRETYTFGLRHAWLAYLAGDYATAIKGYQAAAQKHPKAVEPLVGVMLPQMAARKWLDAIEAGKTVMKIDPNNYYALSRTAYSLFNMGRYKEAQNYYERILELYPSDVEMQSGLAWSLLKQGQRDAAAAIFRPLVVIAPNYESARQGLTAVGADR